MSLLLRACLILLSSLWSQIVLCAPADLEPRLALLIGNASYKASPLANPVNDVRLMEGALKEAGFTVIKAENASIRDMRRLVRDFGDRLKASGGVGLFYFAGHGVQVRGENYLVSTDSDIRNEDEVADDSVNTSVVLEKMQGAGNRMNLIVLDACRNNPFAVKSRSATSGLATMNAPSGSLVAYSTAPGSVASDGTGKNGLYTEYLAKAIRQPGLPVEEVFKLVRAAVRRDSNNQQIPWENTALEGQFFFKPPIPIVQTVLPTVAPVAQPPKGPDPVAMELAVWDSVKAATTAGELQAYLGRYPQGLFADVVRARIAALASAASEKAAMEKSTVERVAHERATAEAYLKASNERAAAERIPVAPIPVKVTDPLALDMAFWESVKTSQRVAELQAYLNQFPSGVFAVLAKGRLDELKQIGQTSERIATKPMAVQAPAQVVSPSAEGVIGTLVFTDTLTGLKRSVEVKEEASDAEKTAYSSGDVIAKDGRVLQVRVGEAVLRLLSGDLWRIPLKAGLAGGGKVTRTDVSNFGSGELEWKSVDAGAGKVRVEAQIRYAVSNPGGKGMGAAPSINAYGKWLAVYAEGQALPESFSAVIRPVGAGNMVSAELLRR